LISKELLDILACPKCKSDLKFEKEENILICKNCKLIFPIIDDIPVLLIEEAKPLDQNDKYYR